MDFMFITPYVPIPRMMKRVRVANNIGSTKIVYWDRGTDDNNEIEFPKEVEVEKIVKKGNEGNPLKRVGATLYFLRKALMNLKKERPKCIHVTKTDALLLVWLYCILTRKNTRVIYEVSDLHKLAYNDSNNIFRILIKKMLFIIERIGMSKVDSLIVTSESFWKEYYNKMINREQVLFIPNSPREEIFNQYVPKKDGKFTVGFIGKIRYKNQLKMLIDVAEEININVLIAGNGIDYEEIKQYSSELSNVEMYGSYIYESEIIKLYGKIDCVYSVYDTSISNVRIALPNRLYEAAKCGLPIIASKNTELADVIENHKIGIIVDDNSKKELMDNLKTLMNDKKFFNGLKRRCKAFYTENSNKENDIKMMNEFQCQLNKK